AAAGMTELDIAMRLTAARAATKQAGSPGTGLAPWFPDARAGYLPDGRVERGGWQMAENLHCPRPEQPPSRLLASGACQIGFPEHEVREPVRLAPPETRALPSSRRHRRRQMRSERSLGHAFRPEPRAQAFPLLGECPLCRHRQ